MQTIYDWITVAIAAGLVVLMLQRSLKDEPGDRLIDYLPPALGCAGANYLGNEGHHFLAIPLIAAVLAYSAYVLKPWRRD